MKRLWLAWRKMSFLRDDYREINLLTWDIYVYVKTVLTSLSPTLEFAMQHQYKAFGLTGMHKTSPGK